MTLKSERKAFFAGSFNPFTVGHLSIAERGLELFDGIVIGIGKNVEKKTDTSAEERVENIRRIFKDNPRVEVVLFKGLAIDAAREAGCECLLRGVRSVSDFETERNMADVNRMIGGMETVLLFSEPEFSCISSSMVRELNHFGVDVTDFLPSTD